MMNTPKLNDGEIYIGAIISADGSRNHHLILLPDLAKNLCWEEAIAWAESIGGELPDRVESALLFAHVKDHVKDGQPRARAIRRVLIEEKLIDQAMREEVMTYEAFRITFQDAEQAARAAYKMYCESCKDNEFLKEAIDLAVKDRDHYLAESQSRFEGLTGCMESKRVLIDRITSLEGAATRKDAGGQAGAGETIGSLTTLTEVTKPSR